MLADLCRAPDEGSALLDELRAGRRCHDLPIVGFGAPSARDACAHGASCCVASADDRWDLADVLERTLRFWCEVVALPTPADAVRPAVALAGRVEPALASTRGRPRWEAPAGTVGGLGRPMEILLVEDNPGDVLLTSEALDRAGGAHRLHVVGDGGSALSFLRREAPFADAPRTDLVLLDLSLPGMPGGEVLARIRDDARLRTVSVVVLTSSSAVADVDACYARRASCYMHKPRDHRQFEHAVGEIARFWCETAELPSG